MTSEACISVAILTVSDTCSEGKADDLSGKALAEIIKESKLFPSKLSSSLCVNDDKTKIKETLIKWCSDSNIDFIITTGGTGLSPRDVTPEAVKEVIERETPGISQQMINESLKVTPMAMLSRPVCGTVGKTLIVTLPGSRKASVECLSFIAPGIPHAVDLLKDNKKSVENTHKNIQGTNQGCSHACRGSDLIDRIDKIALRDRKNPHPRISVEEALKIVLSMAQIGEVKKEKTKLSNGFSLAEDVYSCEPLPPFPASIKDGYAVLSSDGAGKRKVLGGLSAGDDPKSKDLQPGMCYRINTGAPIPQGADSVVQVEDTELLEMSEDGKEEFEIKILVNPSAGLDIRPLGSDIAKDQLLFKAGTKITPSELGVLASGGVKEIKVHSKPVVGILSTGNELLDADFPYPLLPGAIYDSNKITLLSLLQSHSIPVFDAGRAQDISHELVDAITKAFELCDILVTTGGVSMGDRDIVKTVLVDVFKATIHFGQVFMKPGKPTAFATVMIGTKQKLVLCLPGNPVSALVTAHLYLLPLSRKMSGFQDYISPVIRVKLGFNVKLDPRPEYHRCSLEWKTGEDLPTANSTGNQISSRLLSMSSAQALLLLPPKIEGMVGLESGCVVEAILIGF